MVRASGGGGESRPRAQPVTQVGPFFFVRDQAADYRNTTPAMGRSGSKVRPFVPSQAT
jgi:hypothetical protein